MKIICRLGLHDYPNKWKRFPEDSIPELLKGVIILVREDEKYLYRKCLYCDKEQRKPR